MGKIKTSVAGLDTENLKLESDEPLVSDVSPYEDLTPRTDGLVLGSKKYGWLQRLPDSTDDLDKRFGLGLKRRMSNDPQISASVEIKVQAALSSTLQNKPSIQDTENPEYNVAVIFKDFINRSVSNLDEPFETILADMARNAAYFGHSLAEVTWERKEKGIDSGRAVLKSIRTKPIGVYGFVQDPFGNTPTVAVWHPDQYKKKGAGNQLPPMALVDPFSALLIPRNLVGGIPVGQLDHNWKLVPRRKFAVMTHRKQGTDPRGQSILGPAYNAWFLLMSLWPEYLKYLVQFATPSIVGTTSEKAVSEKNKLTGEVISPVTQLYNLLIKFKNGSVLAVPFGSKVDLISSSNDGGAFALAINTLNEQIVKAILFQTLATGEGKHMARAASTTHQDVFNIGVRTFKKMITSMIREDIYKPLIIENFGEEYVHLTPYPSLGETDPEDMGALWTAYAALLTSGGLDESQLQGTDAIVGLPVRAKPQYSATVQAKMAIEEEKLKLKDEANKAAAKSAEIAAKNPPPAPAAKPAPKKAKD